MRLDHLLSREKREWKLTDFRSVTFALVIV